MIVIDTSVAIDHLRGKNTATKALENARRRGPVLMPALAAWELWKGATTPAYRDAVSVFLGSVKIDPFSAAIAQLAGELHRQQREAGNERPTFDLLIASHAIHHRCPFLCTDNDFEGIPGLNLEMGS